MNEKCSFCAQEKDQLFKSPRANEFICPECVGGVHELMIKKKEKQKIIYLEDRWKIS